jgi:hypothetical protein
MSYICGVSKKFGDWYQKTNKTENKKNNFIGLQNTRHPSQHTVGNVHKASGNCQQRAAAIQQRVTAVLRSIPKEACAVSFQKLNERCQPCVVKDGD